MVNTIINTNEVSTIEEVFINLPQEKVPIFGGEDILLIGAVLTCLIALSLMSLHQQVGTVPLASPGKPWNG